MQPWRCIRFEEHHDEVAAPGTRVDPGIACVMTSVQSPILQAARLMQYRSTLDDRSSPVAAAGMPLHGVLAAAIPADAVAAGDAAAALDGGEQQGAGHVQERSEAEWWLVPWQAHSQTQRHNSGDETCSEDSMTQRF